MPNTDNILENILNFCSVLRDQGIIVTTGQVLRLIEGLTHIELICRSDVKSALVALLINQKTDIETFHQAFNNFWSSSLENKDIEFGKLLQPTTYSRKKKMLELVTSESAFVENEDVSEIDLKSPHIRYSSQEHLRQKDFAKLTASELKQVKRLMRKFSWSPPVRKTRRKLATRRGRDLDFRQLFRASLKYEGWPILLTWKSRKVCYRPLVLICDVSGSMESYSRILLQFSYVLSRGWKHVEVFLFSTRLTRITHQLRHKDIDVALDHAVLAASDWGGGTRIGGALREFNYKWSRRVLNGGAVVLIISDGWDRGNSEYLAKEMEHLSRSCHRLIWLNPLLGMPGYQPLTEGILAALPKIDFFLPVHNFLSLEKLASLLKGLDFSGGRNRIQRDKGSMSDGVSYQRQQVARGRYFV